MRLREGKGQFKATRGDWVGARPDPLPVPAAPTHSPFLSLLRHLQGLPGGQAKRPSPQIIPPKGLSLHPFLQPWESSGRGVRNLASRPSLPHGPDVRPWARDSTSLILSVLICKREQRRAPPTLRGDGSCRQPYPGTWTSSGGGTPCPPRRDVIKSMICCREGTPSGDVCEKESLSLSEAREGGIGLVSDATNPIPKDPSLSQGTRDTGRPRLKGAPAAAGSLLSPLPPSVPCPSDQRARGARSPCVWPRPSCWGLCWSEASRAGALAPGTPFLGGRWQ